MIKAQELRDLRAARDDLERRVHDLKLTRQVTMQSLPSIRLVQENDKSLVTKINSTLVNTVPLWETQLAQAVTIQRSAEAAKAVKEATDLTNELLKANAENLREANKMIREEMERGVFDIEAIKSANADLIATIEESLQIADEGKAKRAEAEKELQKHGSRAQGDAVVGQGARHRVGAQHRQTRSEGERRHEAAHRRTSRYPAGRGHPAGGLRVDLARAAAPAPVAALPRPVEPAIAAPDSGASAQLADYYARVQTGLLSQGLLRTDSRRDRRALHPARSGAQLPQDRLLRGICRRRRHAGGARKPLAACTAGRCR